MRKHRAKTFTGALAHAKDSSVTFDLDNAKPWLLKMKPGTTVMVTVEWTEEAPPQ